MNTLEFAKEVVAVISDDDLSHVIKKAASNGFVVQGFKSPWKAPRAQIIGPGFARKKSGGDYAYITFLKAVVDFKIIINEDVELSTLVEMWFQDEKSHDEIVEKLLELNKEQNKADEKEEYIDVFQDNKEKLVIANDDKEGKEKIVELQEKNKKLRQNNQSNKIALDNSQKLIKQLQKENEKQKKDLEKLITKNEENENKIRELQEQIVRNEGEVQELVSEIENLGKYKQRAPKVLCFCKRKLDETNFEGYDVIFENTWDDEVRDRLSSQSFAEIWFVSKGFTYNASLEIQDTFCCSVKKYLNIEKMLSEIGG